MYNNRRLWEEANFRLNYLTERQTNREMWIEQLNAWMSFLDILTNVFFYSVRGAAQIHHVI